jgi:hypothetical protein
MVTGDARSTGSSIAKTSRNRRLCERPNRSPITSTATPVSTAAEHQQDYDDYQN